MEEGSGNVDVDAPNNQINKRGEQTQGNLAELGSAGRKESLFKKRRLKLLETQEKSKAEQRTEILLDEISIKITGGSSSSVVNHMLDAIAENPETKIETRIQIEAKPNRKPCIFEKTVFRKHQIQSSELLPNLTCKSVIVQNESLGNEIHEENINKLSSISKDNILKEQEELLSSVDSSLVEFLKRKRLSFTSRDQTTTNMKQRLNGVEENIPAPVISSAEGPISKVARDLIIRGNQEQWLNFDVIEIDKFKWMSDIPEKLDSGEQYQARFDWNGILLPYNVDDIWKPEQYEKYRHLYLHGEEPNRPGYTLQELFRLARSNVQQQRIAAFAAIGGLLHIYNQGFYDRVLDLPVSNVFFLLRYGFDDNTNSQLEVVSKALSYLFYNETDETLLDYMHESADYHLEPTLSVLAVRNDAEDPNSIEMLQEQMESLSISFKYKKSMNAKIYETDDKNRTSISDFHVAETDLIDCLMGTNILQRIYYIINKLRTDNSTVKSCLQILIRIARSSKELALEIIHYSQLINALIANFLPTFRTIDITLPNAPYYNYPQYLCLKLLRILIAHDIDIASQLKNNANLLEILQDYLQPHEILRNNLIKVQIEALRVVRSFLYLHAIGMDVFKQFLPALRSMLDWHLLHCVFKEGGSPLIRQHAAAVLAAIVATQQHGVYCSELRALLDERLQNCCSKWMHEASSSSDLGKYSQATLISACLNVIAWYMQYDSDPQKSIGFMNRYFRNLVQSKGFAKCVDQLQNAAMILRNLGDRRFVHVPLPNIGAVLTDQNGPRLAINEIYPVGLVNAVFRLYNLSQKIGYPIDQFGNIFCAEVIDSIVNFLKAAEQRINRYLTSNIFARTELALLCDLLNCDIFIQQYIESTQLYRLSYKLVYCLPSSAVDSIETMFDKYIFNANYIKASVNKLTNWKSAYLKVVKSNLKTRKHNAITVPFTEVEKLPIDWPYIYMTEIIRAYIGRTNNLDIIAMSEKDILCMTFDFIWHIEEESIKMDIVSPEEKLMYLMIAFMGPNSDFALKEVLQFLEKNIRAFYSKNVEYRFNFEAKLLNKSKFENLYLLFLKEFEASSYGEQFFGSLVLLPMAQKYDKKWRKRVWSERTNSLRFLDCDEDLLIGGLSAYFEPIETDASLLKFYETALKEHPDRKRILVPGTVPYKIAVHHTQEKK